MKKEQKTNAMRILEKAKLDFKVHTYDCEEFLDGETIARELGQPAEQTFKTLVTVGKSKNHFVFVLPVNQELDLKKAARAVGEKSVEMIHVKEIFNLTGYIRGGCSPVGMKKAFKTVIDQSAEAFDTICFSGGRRGAQIEMNPKDLAELIKAEFEDILVSENH